MKITYKALSFIMAAILMLSLFTGCTDDEITFMSYVIKTADIKSANITTNFSMDVNTDSAIFKDEYSPLGFFNFLSDLKFSVNQKYIRDRDNNQLSAKVQYGALVDDMSFDFTGWVDASNENLVEIFKIPTIAKLFMPYEYKDAKYLVFDFNKLKNSEYFKEDLNIESQNLVDEAFKLQDSYKLFLKNYVKTAKIDIPVIKLSQKDENGSIYSVSLSDSELKALVKSAVGDFFNNAETRALVKELVLDIVDFYNAISPGLVDKAQVDTFFAQVEQNPDMFLQTANSFLAIYDGINILGKDGVKINYTVDSSGYIVKTDCAIDISLDVSAMEYAFSGSPSLTEDKKVLDMLLNYDTTLNDINSVTDIKLPEITENNSIDYVKMMEDQMAEYEDWEDYIVEEPPIEEGEIVVRRYSERINFVNKPVMDNDVLYVPLTEFIEKVVYGYTWWDDESGAIKFAVWGNEYYYYPGDSIIYTDGLTYYLDHPTKAINGIDYVPLRSFAKMFDYNIRWAEEENTAHLS